MKRMFFLPALTVAVVVLAGCDVPANVSSPISEPGLASYDDRLVGTWYRIDGYEDEAGAGTLTVSPGKDGFLDVVGVWTLSKMGSYPSEGNEDRKVSAGFAWIRWAAHASVIDGETYFNARNVDTPFLRRKPASCRRSKKLAPSSPIPSADTGSSGRRSPRMTC
jgi:hypothetical protein